jgi:hypothetical protein
VTAPQPPQELLPPDAPATVEDVRGARRWTWVAFAWAVAASIVAVIALVQANKDNTTDTSSSSNQAQQAAALKTQLDGFVKQTNDRLDQFGKRLDQAASSDDLAKIDKRLTTVEDDLSKLKSSSSDQADTIKQIQTDLTALTKRVQALEQQQSQGQNQGGQTQTTP